MESHGSDERLNAEDGAAHWLNGSADSCQVRPPSKDEPATRPFAPPSFQRSCCQVATRFRVSRGLWAIQGSTSALGLSTPPNVSVPTPTHAANGSPWDVRTAGAAAAAGAAHASASTAANADDIA